MQLSKYAKHLRVSVSTFHFDKDCCRVKILILHEAVI